MKDEEMAEEYTAKNGFGSDCNNLTSYDANKEIEQAFLAGLKEGRPQWHKVADGDLPKKNKEYVVKVKEYGDISVYIGRYWKKEKLFTGSYLKELDVIAWCEIPTFDKE